MEGNKKSLVLYHFVGSNVFQLATNVQSGSFFSGAWGLVNDDADFSTTHEHWQLIDVRRLLMIDLFPVCADEECLSDRNDSKSSASSQKRKKRRHRWGRWLKEIQTEILHGTKCVDSFFSSCRHNKLILSELVSFCAFKKLLFKFNEKYMKSEFLSDWI